MIERIASSMMLARLYVGMITDTRGASSMGLSSMSSLMVVSLTTSFSFKSELTSPLTSLTRIAYVEFFGMLIGRVRRRTGYAVCENRNE